MRLTERQSETLALIGLGKTNGEIALLMGISEATVKTHVSDVLRALGVKSRTRAALIATGSDASANVRIARLSDTARDIYRFMRRYLADNAGVPPTVREIADGVGVGSTSGVAHHLRQIEAVDLIVPVCRNGRTYYTVRELAECAKGLE